MAKKTKLGIIGAGNVAWNLVAGLQNSPFEIVQVLSRSGTSAQTLAEEFGISHFGASPADLLLDLDLVLIASSDHSVAPIAAQYADTAPKTIFAHTSGSISLQALAPLGPQIGVFYPMQSFTKGRLTDWKKVPFFLEGKPEILALLRPMAEFLSEQVSELDSNGRLRLHLGAVFASNFANYMWLAAEDTLRALPGLDVKVYEPLVRECVEKAFSLGPLGAHTGPARRGDRVTMDKHLDLLDPSERKIYEIVSQAIFDRFKGD